MIKYVVVFEDSQTGELYEVSTPDQSEYYAMFSLDNVVDYYQTEY